MSKCKFLVVNGGYQSTYDFSPRDYANAVRAVRSDTGGTMDIKCNGTSSPGIPLMQCFKKKRGGVVCAPTSMDPDYESDVPLAGARSCNLERFAEANSMDARDTNTLAGTRRRRAKKRSRR